MKKITIPIIPMGKPRMTSRDRWKGRLCVRKYHAYCDVLRAYAGKAAKSCTGKLSWRAYFPIPQSWSKKEKMQMAGQPHQQTPDRDNVDKGILDALLKQDSHIHSGSLEKYWDDGKGPRIELVIE